VLWLLLLVVRLVRLLLAGRGQVLLGLADPVGEVRVQHGQPEYDDDGLPSHHVLHERFEANGGVALELLVVHKVIDLGCKHPLDKVSSIAQHDLRKKKAKEEVGNEEENRAG
jgi:hypothetical protein